MSNSLSLIVNTLNQEQILQNVWNLHLKVLVFHGNEPAITFKQHFFQLCACYFSPSILNLENNHAKSLKVGRSAVGRSAGEAAKFLHCPIFGAILPDSNFEHFMVAVSVKGAQSWKPCTTWTAGSRAYGITTLFLEYFNLFLIQITLQIEKKLK